MACVCISSPGYVPGWLASTLPAAQSQGRKILWPPDNKQPGTISVRHVIGSLVHEEILANDQLRDV